MMTSSQRETPLGWGAAGGWLAGGVLVALAALRGEEGRRAVTLAEELGVTRWLVEASRRDARRSRS